MISSETEYPFSRTALMYIFMGHVRFEDTKLYEDWFWIKNRIELIKAWVKSINPSEKSITLDNGSTVNYDKLIIASGSKPNKFSWPGQDLQGVQGLYHLQDLERMETATQNGIKRAVIVGGGLIGIEIAEMFHSRNIPVTFLVRESSFWNAVLPAEESDMINNHILAHGIDLQLGEELQEIKGENGKVKSVICKNSGLQIPCDFVGLTVGVSPNIDILKGSEIRTNKGIVVDVYLQTSISDIYAIGDCAELSHPNVGRKSIEAVWYTGRMMGKTIAQTICDKPTKYNPGIWFNSAKFFDIEYQVYGDIPTNIPENTTSLYWHQASENKSIRINFEKSSGAVTGFNLLGIRYRQAVCEKWIRDKTHIETVIENLSLANFDPEFFDQYEGAFLEMYNQKSGKSLTLKSKRKLSKVKKFLFG